MVAPILLVPAFLGLSANWGSRTAPIGAAPVVLAQQAVPSRWSPTIEYGFMEDSKFKKYSNEEVIGILRRRHIDDQQKVDECLKSGSGECLKKTLTNWYTDRTAAFLEEVNTAAKDLTLVRLVEAPNAKIPLVSPDTIGDRRAPIRATYLFKHGSEDVKKFRAFARFAEVDWSLVGAPFVGGEYIFRPFYSKMKLHGDSETAFESERDVLAMERYRDGTRLYHAELSGEPGKSADTFTVFHPYAPELYSTDNGRKTYIIAGKGIFNQRASDVFLIDQSLEETLKTPPPTTIPVSSELKEFFTKFRSKVNDLDGSIQGTLARKN